MVSVVICTYNRSDSLRNALVSLSQVTKPQGLSWEIVVVDNKSTDDTADVVRTFSSQPELNCRYVLEQQQGLSFARNRAIKETTGEILVFTDDDVSFDRSWLTELLAVFAQHDCIACGGKVLPLWECPRPSWFCDESDKSFNGVIVQFDQGDHIHESAVAPFGANMAFRRRAFTRYGLFRTDLGRSGSVLMSGEETELFQRIRSGNEKVFYTPDAIVYHPVSPERIQKSYIQSFFYCCGKMRVRIDGIPAGARRRFSIPQYMFRMLAEASVNWIFSYGPRRRFRNKVQCYLVAGMMVESRRIIEAAKPCRIQAPGRGLPDK